MYTATKSNRQKSLAAAVSLALGTGLAPQFASAAEYSFNWTGYFIMLDSAGGGMANSSLGNKTNNQYTTPISGTLVYDDVAKTGSMTIEDFDFFANDPTYPAQAQAVSLEYIGNGSCTANDPAQGCGAGTLVLANMLFNWNGSNGIPVSVVFDAQGILDNSGAITTANVGDNVTGVGAVPATDGTYIGTIPFDGGFLDGSGYLAMGAMPVVATAWNTSFAPGCTNVEGGCMNVNPSGILPLVEDVSPNLAYDGPNDGGTIAGNPMADGPFIGSNATFALASMDLVGDGSGPTFTTPADVSVTIAETATPTTHILDIGTVADEPDPASDTVEYSLDGGTTWEPDSGGVNNVTFDLTETVNSFTVRWRVTDQFDAVGFSIPNQVVSITITDTTAPVASFPADITVSVESTAETITFEGPGTLAGEVTASDATDPAPTIEWRINDNLDWTTDTPGTNETSNAFAAGANTVHWRVTDATGNTTTHQQTVTLDLPTGIVGEPCTVDPDLFTASITRQLAGSFTMRDSKGSLVGAVDNAVTGTINASITCADESCTDSGATLESPTPFYSNLWSTSAIRLFTQAGTYTFDACLNDGSTNCSGYTPLSMTVEEGQIGAHMLFDWSINRSIDVVVVWDLGCGAAQMVSTDPDGNGIIGTSMVDGPFSGMNAAFDVSPTAGEPPITTGGFRVTLPVVKNPIANTSPLPLEPGEVGTILGGVTITASELFDTYGAASDSSVVESCVGGCFDFEVSGRDPGETIQVVLPLSQPIPWYALYRKYDAGSDSWRTFAVTDTDNIMTAPLDENDRCPEPGAGDYTTYSSGIMANMLRPGDQCVQLTITDNGPNDANDADGVIADPGGVGLTSGPDAPRAPTTDGGGCTLAADATPAQRFDLWLLAGLLGWLGLRRNRHLS